MFVKSYNVYKVFSNIFIFNIFIDMYTLIIKLTFNLNFEESCTISYFFTFQRKLQEGERTPLRSACHLEFFAHSSKWLMFVAEMNFANKVLLVQTSCFWPAGPSTLRHLRFYFISILFCCFVLFLIFNSDLYFVRQ